MTAAGKLFQHVFALLPFFYERGGGANRSPNRTALGQFLKTDLSSQGPAGGTRRAKLRGAAFLYLWHWALARGGDFAGVFLSGSEKTAFRSFYNVATKKVFSAPVGALGDRTARGKWAATFLVGFPPTERLGKGCVARGGRLIVCSASPPQKGGPT